MALNLYRRHRRECTAGHPEDSRSGEFEERKKTWRKCACPIFLSGTLAGKFRRDNTGATEWSDARDVATQREAAGSWDRPAPIPEPATPPGTTGAAGRITIVDATEAFIAKCKNRGIGDATQKKYKTFTKQLRLYADGRGYVHVDQLTVSDMDRFYSSWKDGIRAKAKKLERLKAFVKFCKKREWLTKDIAEDLEAPEGSSIPAHKAPFTDDELKRIYAACDAIGGPKPLGPGYRPWSGEDVKDFVMLSVYTGLRISDVATFNIDERLKGNDVFLRMHKTRKELYTWIPDWLADRMRERAKKSGPLIFRAGQIMNIRSASERWRDNLGKVFALAGPFTERPTPHRFRHTFVRILLEKGVPVADVAELIGDTEEIVRKHYSKWIKTRQERLTKILQEAFDDRPKPKLVALQGRRP